MHYKVLVYGANGHTSKFVVSRLFENGFKPILGGRSGKKILQLGSQFPGL